MSSAVAKDFIEVFQLAGAARCDDGNGNCIGNGLGELNVIPVLGAVGVHGGEEYLPHGIDVCCSAIETAKLREELIAIEDLGDVEYTFNKEKYESEVRRIYGKIADEVLALQEKYGLYGKDRVKIYKEKWSEIRKLLAEAPTAARMTELVEKIGLSYDGFRTLYGEEKLADAMLYAKDLKDRYTVLWTYYDIMTSKNGESK